jgi:hypothetical protein
MAAKREREDFTTEARRGEGGEKEGRRRRDRGSRLQSYAGIRPEAASPLSCGEKGDDLELRTLNLEPET